MSAILFVLEQVSSEGVIIREKGSRALVSFPISKRIFGVAQISEGVLSEDLIAAMEAFARRAAVNWRLID